MKLIRINQLDNVAVALQDLAKGETIEIDGIKLNCSEAISKGHKIALSNIEKGSAVIKYGFEIGEASCRIDIGKSVHTHNLVSTLSSANENSQFSQYQMQNSHNLRTNHFQNFPVSFNGYERPDGQIGIRNEIWLIPTVGCVNSVLQTIQSHFESRLPSHIDSVICLSHQFGCSQLGEDLEGLIEILIGLISNPNACGIVLMGLGCENNRIENILDKLSPSQSAKLKWLKAQSVDDEFSIGLNYVNELIDSAPKFRSEFPLSKLKIGLKCGGSDANSGLSANPLLGRASELLAKLESTLILTEIPEMFGAEDALLKNCETQEIKTRLLNSIENFKDHYRSQGQPIDKNPSPGNIEGGLTTLAEKSLGAIQKCGRTSIVDIVEYGSNASKNGMNILIAPGNDAISSTALAAAGANLILFTTGRGTPFGTVVPTLKISSNSELAQAKTRWIDFDAGLLLKGNVALDECAENLLKLIVETANGKLAKNEISKNQQIAFWKKGVTL